ncbi:zinc-binding alcohol dehydrogenase [Microbacterium sp. bgisy203]|uniref:zinc-binding alcohol dehydrogenase n=1 Tax=Microbacterium sp. bgisy203 TaxID=3413799 RepID=UPI003D72F5A9
MAAGGPEWVVREDASIPVLVALYLRQALGIRFPEELPHLRGAAPTASDPGEGESRGADADADADALADALERQWRTYWDMTVEPLAHRSTVPLDLIDGFDTYVALPVEGFDELAAAVAPHGPAAVAFAKGAAERYQERAKSEARSGGSTYRAYASAIAQHERAAGRRAHSFELNVQVLPFEQRGVWWIGALTVAVTDGLRGDIVAFDAAIAPVIAELA